MVDRIFFFFVEERVSGMFISCFLLLFFHFVTAVDRSKFKKCSDINFCRTYRHLKNEKQVLFFSSSFFLTN